MTKTLVEVIKDELRNQPTRKSHFYVIDITNQTEWVETDITDLTKYDLSRHVIYDPDKDNLYGDEGTLLQVSLYYSGFYHDSLSNRTRPGRERTIRRRR